jgi:hypothetical protein
MVVRARIEMKAMRARKILLTLPFFLKDATLRGMSKHTSIISFLPSMTSLGCSFCQLLDKD